jgi:hypothetical protein
LGHYYVYAQTLFPEVVFEYVIKDSPGLCAIGASLLPEVTFVSNDAEALGQSYDFVFASSSLHYARDHYGPPLVRLRAGMADGDPYAVPRTKQRLCSVQGPHRYAYVTEYPGWSVNTLKMLDFVAARGFDLARQFFVAEQHSTALRRSRQANVGRPS